jgi:hypothetical protein
VRRLQGDQLGRAGWQVAARQTADEKGREEGREMKILIVTIVLLATTATITPAQELRETVRNGRFWNDVLDSSSKIGYMIGFLDGLSSAAFKTFFSTLPTQEMPNGDLEKGRALVYKSMAAKEVILRPFFGKSTVAEVVKGVDQFYEDPANALVPIEFAMQYFQARASGSDMKEWQSKLQDQRDLAQKAAK